MVEAENLSHMQIVAKSPGLLQKLADMITSDKYSQNIPSGCRISTRAMRNVCNNRYPVVTCRVKFFDNPIQGQGKKLTLLCHHIMMLWKLRREDPKAILWSFVENNIVVNHNCHESRCYLPSHISLTTTGENNSKNIHCFGIAECRKCGVTISVCDHEPKCILTKISICSRCICNR